MISVETSKAEARIPHSGFGLALGAVFLLSLAGCSEKKEQPTYGRVPGVGNSASSPQPLDQQQIAAVPAAATPDVNTASLTPGKPLTGNPGAPSDNAPMAGAPPMTGGIPKAPETKVLIGGNKLQVAGIAFTIPDGWKSVKTASSFRAAQFELPGTSGTAELAVFYFGPGQGGTVEDNVRRWAGQFTSDDPTTNTVPTDVAQVVSGDLSLAMVRAFGTYNPGSMAPMMGAASGEPKPHYALFGLVVDGGPEGPIFVKTTGPRATVDEQTKNLEAFARSAKKSSYR